MPAPRNFVAIGIDNQKGIHFVAFLAWIGSISWTSSPHLATYPIGFFVVSLRNPLGFREVAALAS